MRELIRELADMGKTVLLSSHILPELAEMCTTYGIMDSGRMVAAGSFESLLGQAAHQVARAVVLGDPEPARAQALALPCVLYVVSRGDQLDITYEGGPESASGVLTGLISAGVQVVSFLPASNGLEDVFLRVTGQEGTV
jgi:ABC-2 type transport system ATP-binding protein